MTLSSQTIKELRDKSGAGMLDCKKALEESEGNVEKAIEWLRKKGVNTAQKKSSRDASDGLITVTIKDQTAVMTEVNAETDFVAKNEIFADFCKKVTLTCLQNEVTDVDTLKDLIFDNSGKTVANTLTELISKLGENIIIKRLIRLSDGNLRYQKYLHNSINNDSGKIGVLLVYKCDVHDKNVEELSKNLCMHIAATTPKSIDKEGLDKEIVAKEKIIFKEQLKDSGKPENILEKIIEGKIKKFYEDVCLLEQTFVMENNLKIKELISNFNNDNSINFSVQAYHIFKLVQE